MVLYIMVYIVLLINIFLGIISPYFYDIQSFTDEITFSILIT